MPNGRELTPEEQDLLAERKQQVKEHAAAVVLASWDQLAGSITALERAIAQLKAGAGIQ